MLGIANRLEELGVAEWAAAVFRWTSSLTAEAARDWALDRVDRQLVLDLDQVLPAVAEVVLVDAGRAAARRDLVQRDAPVIDRAWLELVVRLGEADVADLELVEMGVRPAHRRLKDRVQPWQRHILRHEQTAPDRWLDVGQADSQLEDIVRQGEP